MAGGRKYMCLGLFQNGIWLNRFQELPSENESRRLDVSKEHTADPISGHLVFVGVCGLQFRGLGFRALWALFT